MKWSILIASALERSDSLNRLVSDLCSQKQRGGYSDVNILVIGDDCVVPLDTKRNQLIALAGSEYVSFIDDDDAVPEDYISTIYPLLDGVDYIGFKIQHYNKGEKSKPTFHSLKYAQWTEDEDGYYRDISHLNPIKRVIAAFFPFQGEYGEDYKWARSIASSGLVQSEHYIDKVMYHYYFDIDRSLTVGK